MKDLLNRAKSGDLDAFAELFEPLRHKIYAVACRLTGPDDADDVVMDTFLKAWEVLPGFRGGSSLSTWLCKIARNKALDALRKRSTRNRHFVPDEHVKSETAFMVDLQQTAPDREVVRKESRQELMQAVMQLPEAHRTALLLRYVDGLSYLEIAATTGVAIGTVMSRLFHGKRKLRTLMSQVPEDPQNEQGEKLQ